MKVFFLYSGFAEVSNNKLIVLSETAFDINEFKLNIYKDSISKYEKLKNETKSESEILFCEKKIEEANTIIEMLN